MDGPLGIEWESSDRHIIDISVLLFTEVVLAAEGAVSPLALSAHVDPLAVGEHGAPRLRVPGVFQRAAVVLTAVINEGEDASSSTGSARDGSTFLAKEERLPLVVVEPFCHVKYWTQRLIRDLIIGFESVRIQYKGGWC